MDVIKWFAEHSDVILLFFDPDKPGTTGETLECLTTALNGMEHKLLIVFNKCDQVSHSETSSRPAALYFPARSRRIACRHSTSHVCAGLMIAI